MQLGRPLQGIRPPALVPTPPTPVRVTATAAAKAAVRVRAVAKAESAPKAKAQPSAPKAKAQPMQTEAVGLECPLCGTPITFKRANRGGCFYGCTEYPFCRGSRRP